MHQHDERLRMAQSIRQAREALSESGELADELDFLQLSTQLLHLELEFSQLHQDLLELASERAPALRHFKRPLEVDADLPF